MFYTVKYIEIIVSLLHYKHYKYENRIIDITYKRRYTYYSQNRRLFVTVMNILQQILNLKLSLNIYP